MNEKDIKKILNREFSKKLIKKENIGGKWLDYVRGAEYIRRLNEAFDHMWDFQIVNHFITEESIVVTGRLTVPALIDNTAFTVVTKEAFGGVQIKRRRKDGKIIELADDYKAAATDALKKACSMLGIGLHLYSEGDKEEDTKESNFENLMNLLSDKQLNMMISKAKNIGWKKQDLMAHTNRAYSKKYNELDKKEASMCIEYLLELEDEKKAKDQIDPPSKNENSEY